MKKEKIDLNKKGIENEIHKKFYDDFNHCNAKRRICDAICDEEYTLEDIRDWCIWFTKKKLAQSKKEILEKVERIKLDMDVVICDCGLPYKDSDPADLVNELVEALKKSLK